jgi:hypothetical protein
MGTSGEPVARRSSAVASRLVSSRGLSLRAGTAPCWVACGTSCSSANGPWRRESDKRLVCAHQDSSWEQQIFGSGDLGCYHCDG